MITEKNVLPALLGYALRQEPVPAGFVAEDQWSAIMEDATRHRVLSTLSCVLPLLNEQPPQPVQQWLERFAMEQMLISSNQLFAAEQLQRAFEECGLYNLTLKGIHTKSRYPQDYMRSMGDLDILSKAEQTPLIRAAMKALDYTDFEEGRKHDHYHRKPYITVEMHRQLVPASSEFSEYYQDIWQRCQPRPGCAYSYTMSVEDEYIFHIIHLVEHFKGGGVGVRFIMDVYVYETAVSMDREYVSKELEKLGLVEFYRNIVKLAQYWFGKGEEDVLVSQMGSYILAGGVYGSLQNAQALAVTKHGRLAFLLRACFPSLKEMCSMFPWLEKCPIALPIAWLIRGVRSLLLRRKNVKKQLATYANADAERGYQLRQFYKNCGLEN